LGTSIVQMNIRRATKNDAAVIATCLLLAMEEIVYTFIGKRDAQEAFLLMRHFVATDQNQYSYQYCWVAEEAEELIGAANVYDGGMLHTLRQPVLDYLLNQYGRKLQPEDETGPGEYYLDSFGVLPVHQGKGYGAALLQHLIMEYVARQGKVLGLLVEEENSSAKRLYLRLGFQPVGKKVLLGKSLEHLQIAPGSNRI
jgi:ribosomal protein S18 acetylase RimI-like enzyme